MRYNLLSMMMSDTDSSICKAVSKYDITFSAFYLNIKLALILDEILHTAVYTTKPLGKEIWRRRCGQQDTSTAGGRWKQQRRTELEGSKCSTVNEMPEPGKVK